MYVHTIALRTREIYPQSTTTNLGTGSPVHDACPLLPDKHTIHLMGVGEDTQGKIHPGDDFRFKGYSLEGIRSPKVFHFVASYLW